MRQGCRVHKFAKDEKEKEEKSTRGEVPNLFSFADERHKQEWVTGDSGEREREKVRCCFKKKRKRRKKKKRRATNRTRCLGHERSTNDSQRSWDLEKKWRRKEVLFLPLFERRKRKRKEKRRKCRKCVDCATASPPHSLSAIFFTTLSTHTHTLERTGDSKSTQPPDLWHFCEIFFRKKGTN